MGGIGKTLFGSPSTETQTSNSNSSSGNYAYGPVMQALGPSMGYTGAAGGMMGALLGIPGYTDGSANNIQYTAPSPASPATGHMVDLFHDGINGNGKRAQKLGQPTNYYVQDSPGSAGSPGSLVGTLTGGSGGATATAGGAPGANTAGINSTSAGSALQNFSDSAGMKFLEDNGNRMLNSNAAAKGLLNSGSTLKGIADYSNGLHQQYLNQYMQNLSNFGNMGINAANAITGAGNHASSTSTGTGSSKGAKDGIAGTLISGASLIPGVSDRRLKEDIEKVGEYADGLGRYQWTFKEGYGLPKGRQEGVMADEVKELRPWAHIPNFMGEFDGVDYGRL